MRFTLLLTCASLSIAQDIEIRVYSELQRVSPLGDIVQADRAITPREVISPLVARNAHASFHVAVTALPGTIYYIATQSYPRNVVQLRLYREAFVWTGGEYIPDSLTELLETSLRVGVMPDYNAPDPSRTTEVYLLDVWVPPQTPPGIVRVEALVKTAKWTVAPLELRIAKPILADAVPSWAPVQLRPIDAPADSFGWDALFGLGPPSAAAPLNVRKVLQRNAQQDAQLAKRVDGGELGRRVFSALLSRAFTGAESYLPIRNYLLRNSN